MSDRRASTVIIRHPKGIKATDEELLEALRVEQAERFSPREYPNFSSAEELWAFRNWSIDYRFKDERPDKFSGPGVCCGVSWRTTL